MKPEVNQIINWSDIESSFVEDVTYEGFKAPKWVDLSSPDNLTDDEAWFCNPDCKHPKSAEDFRRSARSIKGKLLRSLSVPEVLSFRGKSLRRDLKPQRGEIKSPSAAKLRNMRTKSSKYVCNVNEESENKNPNMAAPLPAAPKSKSRKGSMTPCNEKKKRGDELSQGLSKQGVKPQLKSSVSASNLLKGKQVLNQITEFCTEVKNFAKRCSRKKISEKSGFDEKVRERMPLIVRKGGY